MASLQRKIVKGIEYWSIVESKRVNGKPRPIVVDYIGNRKKLLERLQNNDIRNNSIKSYVHGDTYCLMAIARKLEVESLLDGIFGTQTIDGVKISTSFILAAVHRACRPGSKSEFEDWFKTTTLLLELGIKPRLLTSQFFWRQMDGISETALMAAEDVVTKRILKEYEVELDKLALDFTNYFTYIDTDNERNDLAKRGRNKQKRYDLRQCSLTVVTTRRAGIPLFSHVYEGNKNDQTAFKEYLPILERRMPDCNLSDITLIFDGGGVTKKNMESLKTRYICSFSLSYCKELYEIDIDNYEEIKIDGQVVKYHRTTKSIWGKIRTCVLTFSQELYKGQERELNENIAKTIKQLEELNERINNINSRIDKTEDGIAKRIKQILKLKYIAGIVSVEFKNNRVIYVVCDVNKVELMEKKFGKKLTITDCDDWTTEEILQAYYEQDCIEKIFRDTKNVEHFSIRPMFHWTDQKIRVHIFICLLGLTLTSVLQKELSNNGISISKNRLLETLSLIRQCWVKDSFSNKVERVLEEMDATQSELWAVISNI